MSTCRVPAASWPHLFGLPRCSVPCLAGAECVAAPKARPRPVVRPRSIAEDGLASRLAVSQRRKSARRPGVRGHPPQALALPRISVVFIPDRADGLVNPRPLRPLPTKFPKQSKALTTSSPPPPSHPHGCRVERSPPAVLASASGRRAGNPAAPSPSHPHATVEGMWMSSHTLASKPNHFNEFQGDHRRPWSCGRGP